MYLKKKITEEICKLAVKQNGYALQFVPPKIRTDEFIKDVVQNNECALKYAIKYIYISDLLNNINRLNN